MSTVFPGVSKRGRQPLFLYLPLPENAGRGTKGVGYQKKPMILLLQDLSRRLLKVIRYSKAPGGLQISILVRRSFGETGTLATKRFSTYFE